MNRNQYLWQKGILVVSFGTTHIDAIDQTIGAIEAQIQQAFKEYRIYRAFTSKYVLRTLEEEKSYKVQSVAEALIQMKKDGITDVIIQPTMIVHGIEAEQLVQEIENYRGMFTSLVIGAPLLHQTIDYKNVVHAIMHAVSLEKTDALVIIGHGTEHYGNAAYPTLEYTFHAMGYTNVMVGTIGEFPGIQQVLDKLEIQKPSRVKLFPFFVVFGEHVRREVTGEGDTWEQKLRDKGYEVSMIQKSFGEIEGISKIYCNHIEQAI